MSNEKEEKVAEQPLLSEKDTDGIDRREMFDPKKEPPTTRSMVSIFLEISIPAIFTNVIAYCTIINNGVFAGHMNDPVKLAVIGLTNTITNVMC